MMNDMNRTAFPPDAPKPSAADMRRLIAGELSLPARIAHTVLLLAALGGAGVTGTLLLTEQGLPARTRLALAVLAGMGLAWVAFAGWVLTHRRILLAGHRVVAARMAVAFTTIFTIGAWAVGQAGATGHAWYGAAGVGLGMLGVAVVLLMRARRRFSDLSRRRLALERQLGRASHETRVREA